MAYDGTQPEGEEFATTRENFRALKEDAIVNAGTLNSLTQGNASGNIPVSNGTVNTNLNADLLDGQEGSYYAAASSIPTQTSDLTNDSGFLTSESDPVFTASPAYNITSDDITLLGNTSGVNTGDQDLSGLVPKTTTVNGHALSSNISITKSDISLGNVENVDQTDASNISSGVLRESCGGAGEVSGILKADGSGNVSAAVAGTDYLAPTGSAAELTGLTSDQVTSALGYTPSNSYIYGFYTLTASQTSRLSVNNHIELDTAEGTLGGLSTGSGQENGIITLPAGKTYKITGFFRGNHSSASGHTYLKMYDRTNSSYFGGLSVLYGMNSSTYATPQPAIIAVIAPTIDIEIDVRFLGVSYTNIIWGADQSILLIEAY